MNFIALCSLNISTGTASDLEAVEITESDLNSECIFYMLFLPRMVYEFWVSSFVLIDCNITAMNFLDASCESHTSRKCICEI